MAAEKNLLEEKLAKVLDSLLNLQKPEFLQGEKAVKVDASKGIYERDFGMEHWDWPQGVGLYGLEKLQQLKDDNRYQNYLENWYRRNINEGLPGRNINTTAPYIALLALGQHTGNKEFLALCKTQANWLMQGLPRTREGGFQHVTTGFEGKHSIILNDSELWIDTLFMAVLFLAKAGVAFDNRAWQEEAVRQILIHIKYLYEKKNGLFYHGWSFNRGDNFGAVFWNRGNAWFAYGVLELLETLSHTIDRGTRQFIWDTFVAQCKALQGLQGEDGLWHTILNDASSYKEVSGSAAIGGAFLKGVRLGLLEESFANSGHKAIEGVIANIRPDGLVENVSSGTGMGLDAQHYKNIVRAPISYGQSMTAFALIEALEYEKACGR